MAWTVRTTAPTNGTQPYDWDAETKGQCTWYAYWRVQEEGYSPPCWQSGSGSSGSGKYNNAATWLQHYRTPWEVKGTSYSPVAGDLAIFRTMDPAGHVCVIESVSGSYAMITDYNINLDESFSYRSWQIGGGIGATGVLIGYLHYPSSTPPTPPTPPTPTETPTVSFTPSSYSDVMQSTEDYIDFYFTVTVSGIPITEDASNGISFSSNCYRYAYTTGWNYTSYVISGVTYQTGTRSLIVRYPRRYNTAYNDTAYMYYNKNFSNGLATGDASMRIQIRDKGIDETLLSIIANILRRRKRRIKIKLK